MSPKPECPTLVLMNNAHVKTRQSIFGRVVRDGIVTVEFEESQMRSNPVFARAVSFHVVHRRFIDQRGKVLNSPVFITLQPFKTADPNPSGGIFPESLNVCPSDERSRTLELPVLV